jgi:hypothetical protein
VHWIRDIALILGLGWLLLVALTTARAQEPTPEPTPDEFLAGFCDAASFDGGVTRTVGLVAITLPPGTYNITIPPPDPGDTVFLLCHKESGGFLSMDATNCVENSRGTPNAEAEAVIDAIAASCQIAPTPTPEPTPIFACPEGEAVEGGATITIGDNLRVSLPAGDFIIDVDTNADGEELARICNPDEEYNVILRVADCSTPVIAPPNDPDAAVKQAIRASCITLSPAPTPDLAAVTIIQPPNTGDAGLRN